MKNALLFIVKSVALLSLMNFAFFVKMKPGQFGSGGQPSNLCGLDSFPKFAKYIDLGQPIFIENPSFESVLGIGKQSLEEWSGCGNIRKTGPTILSGQFKGTPLSHDGENYIALFVKDNGMQEGISQKLATPLVAGQSYRFSIFLSRAEAFPSLDRAGKSSFSTPCRLQVWGNNQGCTETELLAETSMVFNKAWSEYYFRFTPENTYSYILLKANYKTPTTFEYNGNILLDNISPIQPIMVDTSRD